MAKLRAFRGAISTARLSLPYGPRPGREDNVLFTPTYAIYSDRDRARMRKSYLQKGYTHWAIGPISHRRRLYHDQYPPAPFDSIADPDRYADRLEELWRAGEIPVYFALPDTPDYMGPNGWDWKAVDRDLTPIYRTARWQALIRVVALAWEPDIPSAEWRRGVVWLAHTFPHALRYIHLPAGHQAPCRTSDLSANGGPFSNEAACWKTIAPYLDGVLYQSDAMAKTGRNAAGRLPLEQFRFELWFLYRHLHDGADGWPSTSARKGRSLDIVAFEYASYWSYWKNVPETQAREWGDAAMGIGGTATDPVSRNPINLRHKLSGYGDGGTVAVPISQEWSRLSHLTGQAACDRPR